MEELEEILGELVDDLAKATKTSEYHEPPSTRKNTTQSKNQQSTGSGSS